MIWSQELAEMTARVVGIALTRVVDPYPEGYGTLNVLVFAFILTTDIGRPVSQETRQ